MRLLEVGTSLKTHFLKESWKGKKKRKIKATNRIRASNLQTGRLVHKPLATIATTQDDQIWILVGSNPFDENLFLLGINSQSIRSEQLRKLDQPTNV